jgi:hypothetical protein
MLQKLKSKIIILATLLAAMAPVGVLTAAPAYAVVTDTGINNALCNGADVQKLNDPTASCSNETGTPQSLESKITKAINIFSVLVGIVAVVMIIYGGFRYVTSGGKQESVTNAKNTLLYAIIGLVIVALSQAIVHFVLKSTTTT